MCWNSSIPRILRLVTLLFIIGVVVVVVSAESFDERRAQHVSRVQYIKGPTPSPTPSPLAFTVGTMFSISTQAPIRNMMRRDERFVRGLEYLQRFVEKVESDMLKRLSDKTSPNKSDHFRPCNFVDGGYIRSFEIFAEVRGLPPLDSSCITEYIGLKDSFTAEMLDTAFYNQTIPLYDNRFKIADVILGNWSDADIPYDFTYNSTSQTCVVNSFAGLRLYEKWYFLTTLTNEYRFHNVKNLERQSLSEYLRVNDDGELDDPLKLDVLEKHPDGSQTKNNQTTTILTFWGGEAIPAHYRRIYPEQIPAVIESLQKSDLKVQQSNDALVPSNLLILLLPLAFNLVPIAILTEVANNLMILYTILSDIVTVIPLTIKGIELIDIGRRSEFGVATRLSGSINGTLSNSAAVQLWIARCDVQRDMVSIGIAFVVLSFTFMIVGILLEFTAHWYMKKKRIREHLLAHNQEPLANIQVIANEALLGASVSRGVGDTWRSAAADAKFEDVGDRHSGHEGDEKFKKDLFRTKTRAVDTSDHSP